MKTLIKKSFAFLVAGILLTSHLSANGDKPANTNDVAETSKLIKEQVKFSNLSLNHSQVEKVNVVFTVNEEGRVNLVVANTDNEQLRKTIESQFMKLTLGKLKPNNAYSIQFNFKTI